MFAVCKAATAAENGELPNEGGGDGRAVSDSGSPGARPGRERRTAAEPLRGERSGCGVPRGTEITGLIAKSR